MTCSIDNPSTVRLAIRGMRVPFCYFRLGPSMQQGLCKTTRPRPPKLMSGHKTLDLTMIKLLTRIALGSY